jgi:hypothetical protein
VQGAPASGFQTLVAHGFAQADDSQGGAKGLFGMRPLSHDFLHNLGAIGPDGPDPLQDATGSPLQVLLMGLGPVLLQRREAARQVAAQVGRHAFAVLKELHRFVGQPHIELLMNKPMGSAVEVFFHHYVIVNVDLGLGPIGQLKGRGGQRVKRGAVASWLRVGDRRRF